MPLPPLPENTTARIWFKYVTGDLGVSQEHEVMVRYNSATKTRRGVCNDFLALLQALTPENFNANWRVVSARYSEAGSIVSLPFDVEASLLAFLGTRSTNNRSQKDEAVEDAFRGRSLVSGRKVRFSLYRAVVGIDDTFRYPMSPAVQTVLSAASGSGSFLAIDGSGPSWYTNVNQNYNSYWERELRS